MPETGNNEERKATRQHSDYVKCLKKFGIDPDAVLEPLRVDPGEFIVLILKKDMWATWCTRKKFEIPKEAEPLLARATRIQSTPANFPRPQDDLAFRRIIGSGIAQALTGDQKGAEETLNEAEAYVTRRAAETSRFWYVQASLFTTFIFIAGGLISERLFLDCPGDDSWKNLGLATSFGALGALFSFLSRVRKLKVDPAAGRKAHYGDAFVRILLGGLGAFIFAIGIRAKFVLGFIDSGQADSVWLVYVFCVAAGYSERLVPEFLQQVESRALKSPE